jgi:hypothetical protein
MSGVSWDGRKYSATRFPVGTFYFNYDTESIDIYVSESGDIDDLEDMRNYSGSAY